MNIVCVYIYIYIPIPLCVFCKVFQSLFEMVAFEIFLKVCSSTTLIDDGESHLRSQEFKSMGTTILKGA